MDKKLKQVFQYVLPAMGAMVIAQMYMIVDGIFVGRGVGIIALGAVNIATPYINSIRAVSAMLTVGGATITAIQLGKGNKKDANNAFMASILMVLAGSVLMAVIGIIFSQQIVLFSGADNSFTATAQTYLKYFCLFIAIDCLGICLTSFVRNDGRPGLAFWSMIAGAIANIFLDWLFVFPLQMGVKGAAIASGLGQVISLIMLCSHFMQRKGALYFQIKRPEKKLCQNVIIRGFPELITQLGQPVTILCYNFVATRYLGPLSVAAYSIIIYISNLIVVGLFIGISQGLQPLIGQSYGRNEKKEVAFYFRAGMAINLICSLAAYILLLVARKTIISLFNNDSQLILLTYGISFIFASVNTIFITYFLSGKWTHYALILALIKGFILNTAFILIFPVIWGVRAIWLAAAVVEFVTMLIGLVLKRSSEKNHFQFISCRPTFNIKN